MTEELHLKIDRYAAGQLSEKEAEALWSELMLDPEALDYLKTSATLHSMYRKAAVRRLGLTPLLAIAAVLFGAVVMLNLFRFDENDYVSGLNGWTIDATGFESARENRDESAQNAADSLFDSALTLAVSGNLEKAREQFDRFVNSYPVSVSAGKAWMNIGVILYNQGKYADAVDAFRAALATPDSGSRFMTEKTHWFTANAYFRLGKLQEARNAALEALRLDGTYHDEAIELIRYLDYKLGMVDYKPVEETTAPPVPLKKAQ